ncbi:RcnB family protein [Paucibacter sp. M5-1]|uniref:RcnB family protein n=1 Tax=Paucibacter sp. M5-1 TaxID=3015998 RepID=UPI0022B8C63B|nr:RcnB family protein [Paucibacter sp. M5-1]MCZ7882018.1 RcnB family protein [Paucibacter sp. M5-1]
MSKIKALLLACAVAAQALAPLSLVQAQGNSRGDHGKRGDDRQSERRHDQRHEQRNAQEQRRDQAQQQYQQSRRDGPPRWDSRDGRDYWNGKYANRGRGAGPDHSFYKGNRLPPAYHQRRYVVDDWRSHQLRAPPRGYHWVQSGGDYLLVAIATGVILQLLLSN